MIPLFADVVVHNGPAAWGIGEWAIAIVVIVAIIAILYTALDYFGIAVPPIVLRVIGICLVALLVIVAIRFLLSL